MVSQIDNNFMRKESLVIKRVDQFNELLGLIHDEYFELNDIEHIPEQKVVHIPYCRIFHSGPKRLIRNFFVFKTYEVDVIRSILKVYNAENYTFRDSAKIGTYSFNTVFFKDNNLHFECEPDLKLDITVSGLEVESSDIEIRGKSRITQGLFWDSNTSKVYD